jgi:hypothetical protein
VSRIFQFLSDGMTPYNHARKIMFIPFPFVAAQLNAAFVVIMIFLVPLLMDQYADSAWFGAFLTFLSVSCLSGIHEVARELENPFRNVPNELPIVTLMAEVNEALITMYAGFHPDLFWDGNQNENMSLLEDVQTPETENVNNNVPEATDTSTGKPKDEISTRDERDIEINLLKTIVEQQGRMMEKMMEEQLKISRLVEEALSKNRTSQ